MFKRLSGFLLGYVVLLFPPAMGQKVMDLLFSLGMEFYGERRRRDGSIRLCLPAGYLKTLREASAAWEGTGVTVSDVRGVPVLLRYLMKRPGLTLGILLLLVWCYVSQRIVWDIRIEGNTTTPDREIVELLTDLGCGYGAWFPSIDFDDLHARALTMTDKIGWLSVYMNGTVAEVQVRELVKPDRVTHGEGVYANVVAAEDGVIESVRAAEGQAAVKAGDIVRRGDVVISGVMERKDMNLPEGGVRFEYAAGEVLARTVRHFSVEISLIREEKVYTGAEKREKRIKIFGKPVKLFENTGITYTKYDKIDKMERLSLFGICDLPLWVEETIYREYTYETVEITPEEAAAEGLRELRYLTDEAVEGGELAEKTVTTSMADGVYRIDCLLYVVRDIAETEEFTVPDEMYS